MLPTNTEAEIQQNKTNNSHSIFTVKVLGWKSMLYHYHNQQVASFDKYCASLETIKLVK